MKCKAKSKRSGKRCKRDVIRGGTVCAMHGGKAPQVIAKAKIRLAALVDPAITRLEKVIKKSKHEPSAVAAAKDILDRVGLKPTDKVKFEGDIEVSDPGREKLTDEQLDWLIAQAREASSA